MKKYHPNWIVKFVLFTFTFLVLAGSYPAKGESEKEGLALIKEGEELYINFKYEEAIEKYNQAKVLIKSKKNLVRLYFDLSKAYYALGEVVRTQEILKKMFDTPAKKKLDLEELPKGYIEIYNKIKDEKEKKVIEKPGKEKKKKKSPVLLVLVGIAVVGVTAALLLKKKDKSDGTPETPEPTSGSIKVESTPSEASIWLDGTDTGRQTTAVLENISPGVHAIRLIKSGYFIFETTVDVRAGEQAPVSATLERGLDISWLEIPQGDFLMGDNFDEGDRDEIPVHTVYLDTYYISKYEVTFEKYDRFCDDAGHSKPSDSGFGRGNRPVINVTWDDAKAFCDWLSSKTGENIYLPTEAQWEKAARGTDQRMYPWGDTGIHCGVANYKNCNNQTVPVGSYPAAQSPYGVFDMAGNVWEWCQDWYDENYYSISPRDNPQGPTNGIYKAVRGGGWVFDKHHLRTSNRHSTAPSWSDHNLGFRICRD